MRSSRKKAKRENPKNNYWSRWVRLEAIKRCISLRSGLSVSAATRKEISKHVVVRSGDNCGCICVSDTSDRKSWNMLGPGRAVFSAYYPHSDNSASLCVYHCSCKIYRPVYSKTCMYWYYFAIALNYVLL